MVVNQGMSSIVPSVLRRIWPNLADKLGVFSDNLVMDKAIASTPFTNLKTDRVGSFGSTWVVDSGG